MHQKLTFLDLLASYSSFLTLNKMIFKMRWSLNSKIIIEATRKYPLRGYILVVLTHTGTWDQNWGDDETLE